MKLAWRIIVIAAVVLLLLGAALIAVALFTGGSLDSIRNNVMLTNFQQDFGEELPTELHITADLGNLSVLPGEQLRVEARNVLESGFSCTLTDGVLTVRENPSASWADSLSRLLSLEEAPPAICIYLPEGLLLSGTEIELAAGEANIRGLNTRQLKLDMNAGDLLAESLTAETAELEIRAGVAEFRGLSADTLKLDMDTGKLTVTGSIARSCSLDLATGAAELELTGSAENYTAQIEAGAGSIVYDGHDCSMETCRIGDGMGEMKLYSAAGMIDVSFAE